MFCTSITIEMDRVVIKNR